MKSAKFTATVFGAGLLALTSSSSLLAEGTTHHDPAQKNVVANSMREVPLGLLIKTPDTPHGISFSRQVA